MSVKLIGKNNMRADNVPNAAVVGLGKPIETSGLTVTSLVLQSFTSLNSVDFVIRFEVLRSLINVGVGEEVSLE